MILLLPGSVKHVYLACGCRKVEIDADDLATFYRKCRDCKKWTRFTVCPSPSGQRIEVQRHIAIAPVELSPRLPGASVGEGDGGLSSTSPTANRRNANRGARP